jgi:ribosomal protein L11
MNGKVTTIKIFVDAGEAKGGPPLGPVLGQYQIDINSFCKEFNEKTSKAVKGVVLPVVIQRFENKSFKLSIKHPTINFIFKQISDNSKFIKITQVFDLLKIISIVYKIEDLKRLANAVFGSLSSMKVKIKN